MSEAKKLARRRVRGLWIAIPTPFTADARLVDEDLLRAAVEHYVAVLQVDGIFCGGVMGEFWALTLKERERVHELVAEQVSGRVPVMAHVGHHGAGEAIKLANHAASSGIEFGIAINPYYPPHLPDALVHAWYATLTRGSSLPLFLFNTSYSGCSLSPELISGLADLDTVCGIKNPRPMEHLLRVQELAGQRIVVTDASERDWLQLHLEHGFQSLMSTPALALYQRAGDLPVLEYTRRADSGDIEGAWAQHARLEPQRAAFDRWMRDPWLKQGVVPIAPLKAWLGLMGIPQGSVRAPLVALPREEEAQLRAELEMLELVG
jgi:4-hydroxy-tetrahydrodipicolinate synthase